MPIAGRLTWRTSSFSSNGETCVEVALTDTGTALRDTKHRAGGQLTLPAGHGRAFITAVKTGHLDH